MTTHSIGKDNLGATIEVCAGDEIGLTLEENPTTGYRWELEPLASDAVVLRQEDFAMAAEPRIGSGGTRRFRFQATKAGVVDIRLRHWQSWSGEASITERFWVRVTVKS